MSNTFQLGVKQKKYDIVDLDGNVLGQFSFNPSDTNLKQRYKEVSKELNEIGTELEKKKQDNPGFDELDIYDSIVYEKINYLLAADVAKHFFSIMGPFSLLEEGGFFVESVLSGLGNLIQEEMEKRKSKTEEKIRQHTEKYHA